MGYSGVCKWFNQIKGNGIIVHEDLSDASLNGTEIVVTDKNYVGNPPKHGDRLYYELEWQKEEDKFLAVNVSGGSAEAFDISKKQGKKKKKSKSKAQKAKAWAEQAVAQYNAMNVVAGPNSYQNGPAVSQQMAQRPAPQQMAPVNTMAPQQGMQGRYVVAGPATIQPYAPITYGAPILNNNTFQQKNQFQQQSPVARPQVQQNMPWSSTQSYGNYAAPRNHAQQGNNWNADSNWNAGSNQQYNNYM